MKLIWLITCALITSLSGCVTTPASKGASGLVYLQPFATPADSEAIVRYVMPDSPAESVVTVGDKITYIDAVPINNTWEFFTTLSPSSNYVRVLSNDGIERQIPVAKLIKPDHSESWFLLMEPGQTLSFKQQIPIYKKEQAASLLYPKNSTALVSARIWPTKPQYLEVYLEMRVSQDCMDCALENIAVLDLSRNSWLSPVTASHVAWALYPKAGQAPSLMPVPPPTPIGYTATSTTRGTVTARSYGNSMSGTYSGTGSAQVSPYYDYTMTNIALAQNLAATIQRNKIREQGEARVNFVNSRLSNLRIGRLNPGEIVTGFVHYQVPDGFVGPYLVVVKAGNLTFSRFSAPEKD